jgi:signal transduction histidine kinase
MMTFMVIVYEAAATPRSWILYGSALILVLMAFIRGKSHVKFGWSLIVDILIVYAMGYYSRFNINYIILALNLWILIESIVWQSFVRSVLLVAGTYFSIGLSLVVSANYGMNYQSLSQMALILAFFIVFTVLLFMYNSYIKERTEVRALNLALTQQNDQLTTINQALIQSKEALEEANREVARLTRLRERSRFARDLHDTVGHELTGLIMSLEMQKLSHSPETESHKAVQMAIDQAREILRAMRALVDAHKDVILHENLYEALVKKLENFESQTGISTKLTYDLLDEQLDEAVIDALYKTVIESVTNTAKHGNATKLWVSFQKLNSGEIILKIVDNGDASATITKGNGLKFIEERITRLGGSAVFEHDGNGFRTSVKIGRNQ